MRRDLEYYYRLMAAFRRKTPAAYLLSDGEVMAQWTPDFCPRRACGSRCVCGRPIKDRFFFIHRTTGEAVGPFGEDCMQYLLHLEPAEFEARRAAAALLPFGDDAAAALSSSIDAVKALTAGGGGFTARALACCEDKGIITPKEKLFLSRMVCKRSIYTPEKARAIAAIIEKISAFFEKDSK